MPGVDFVRGLPVGGLFVNLAGLGQIVLKRSLERAISGNGALNVAEHTAQIIAYLLDLFAAPVHLPRRHVLVCQKHRLLALAHIALTHINVMAVSCFEDFFTGFVAELRVGWKAYRFLLHRRIHIHLLQVSDRHRPGL